MQADGLISILQDLNSRSPEIEASAIISTEGLKIASTLPAILDNDLVGAMTAALLSRAQRTATALERGELEQFLVIGEKGGILMVYVDEGALLVVLTKPTARHGLIFFELEKSVDIIIQKIKENAVT